MPARRDRKRSPRGARPQARATPCTGLLLALLVAPCLAAARAAGPPVRRGDTVVVRVQDAPVQRGRRVVAHLPKGQSVEVTKVTKRGVFIRVKKGRRTVKGFVDFAFLDLDGSSRVAARPATSEWPQYRGPYRDGWSLETGLLKEWPKKGPKRLWTGEGCGIGYASVAVAGGRVFTTGNVQNQTAIVAFDLNGRRVWVSPFDQPYWEGGYPGTRSTPTVDGDRVYAESPYGVLVCADVQTGKPRWKVNMAEKFGARRPNWGFAESPLVDGPNVIVCPGGPRAAAVALDKLTGRTRWVCRSGQDMPSYASPVVCEHGGLRQIVAMTSEACIGIHARTGRRLWRHPHSGYKGINPSTPLCSDGHVFFASGYGRGAVLLKLQVRGKQVTVKEVWRRPAFDSNLGGVVLVDGFLYGCDDNGNWMSTELKTGRIMYRTPGVRLGSVIYADGMLYCLTQDRGVVALVKATPSQYKVISHFAVPGAKSRVWALPAISDGRLYVRYLNWLHAFDIRADAQSE